MLSYKFQWNCYLEGMMEVNAYSLGLLPEMVVCGYFTFSQPLRVFMLLCGLGCKSVSSMLQHTLGFKSYVQRKVKVHDTFRPSFRKFSTSLQVLCGLKAAIITGQCQKTREPGFTFG